MELIGKKITRQSAFEASTKATVTVGKGKLKFSGAAMRGIGLFNTEIGIGYEANQAFLYVTGEGEGVKVHENGAVNNKYHSKALLDTFLITEETAELNVSTEPKTFDEFPGMTFYEITTEETVTPEYAPISAESSVEEPVEEPVLEPSAEYSGETQEEDNTSKFEI